MRLPVVEVQSVQEEQPRMSGQQETGPDMHTYSIAQVSSGCPGLSLHGAPWVGWPEGVWVEAPDEAGQSN